MRIPISWLQEYGRPSGAEPGPAGRSARRSEVGPAARADRGRPGGRVGRAGRPRHQQRRDRAGARDRGADRVQEADPVLPGADRRRARCTRSSAARSTSRWVTWWRSRCRARRCPAGSDRRPQGLRADVGGHDLLAIGAGHRRRPLRHPGPAPGRTARRDFAEYAGLRDGCWTSRSPPTAATRCPSAGVARDLAIAFGAAFTDPAAGPPDDPARQRACYPASIGDPTGCDRFVLREVRGLDPARRRRCPWVCGWPAPGCAHLARGGRHQLRDARARPAAARVRPGHADRPHRGPPGGAGREAGDAGPRGPRARPGRHPDHRFLRADLAGRHDGRHRDRDLREVRRPGRRGRAFLAPSGIAG